jgi:hypothetical protein
MAILRLEVFGKLETIRWSRRDSMPRLSVFEHGASIIDATSCPTHMLAYLK